MTNNSQTLFKILPVSLVLVTSFTFFIYFIQNEYVLLNSVSHLLTKVDLIVRFPKFIHIMIVRIVLHGVSCTLIRFGTFQREHPCSFLK